MREKEEDDVIVKEALEGGEDIARRYDASPSFINGTMKGYQVNALNWIISRHDFGVSGILADEMSFPPPLPLSPRDSLV